MRKILVALVLASFAAVNLCYAAAPEPGALQAEPAAEQKPLIIYYSLTGTTKTIAAELSRALSCEAEELVSRKSRQNIGKVTCVNDQLFDRDDDLCPAKRDLKKYTQFIIASPVWLHTISSPVRTLLKYSGFKGKTVWLVLTNRGNFRDADEKSIVQFLSSRGITVKGCYTIRTSEKTDQELILQARLIARDISRSLNHQ
jgi:flavodoxin